ncbi:hypothetical protein MAMT_01836 [Methylacidimicrobium tartarophylax]|uniref:Uncharacterized protein n=2 Tax=Methylacidimicrobium tartarophylax TaxID=1041768 RepID=A0A5E6MNN7_9BACT|nr:hypothetical protein MAMT_01836 [Methylacidimicrobium tartarophylax]
MSIATERFDAVETLVRQACEDSIRPPLAPIIECMTLPNSDNIDRPVIRIAVERSLFVHQSPGGLSTSGRLIETSDPAGSVDQAFSAA